MRISLQADFACRVLIQLAAIHPRKSSIPIIADKYSISQNHLVKVVHKLAQEGFVATERGRNGGITLGRPAENITLGAVLRAMEPSLALVECFNPPTNTCILGGHCLLSKALHDARAEFFRVLDGVTIDQVASMPALKEIFV